MRPERITRDLPAVVVLVVILLPTLGTLMLPVLPSGPERDALLAERGKSYLDAFDPTTKDVFLLIDERSPAYDVAAKFGSVEEWGVRISSSSLIYPFLLTEDSASVSQKLDKQANIIDVEMVDATVGKLYEVRYALPETIEIEHLVSQNGLDTITHRSGDDVYIYARAGSPVEPFASYNKGGYQDYYVIGDDWDDPSQPGNDEQTMLMFKDWVGGAYKGGLPVYSGAHTKSVVSFVGYGTVKIYLDEVENGYAFDENTFTGADKTFLLQKSQVLTLNEYNRYAAGSIGISGQDRFFTAGAPVFMVHGAWPSEFGDNGGVKGEISAELWPQYPVLSQQTSYVTPVGFYNGAPDTLYTYMIIQAFQDGTTIKINDPTTGINPDYKGTLDKGDVFIYGRYCDPAQSQWKCPPLPPPPYPAYPTRPSPGTTISATAPVQAGLFCSGGGSIDTRYYMLTPQGELGSRYISPVSSDRYGGQLELSRLYIYSFADQTIHILDKNGVQNIVLKGGQTYSSYVMPEASAAYIYNDFPNDPNYKFWILGAFDSSDAKDDWGFQPIDAGLLNKEYYIPYAPSLNDAQPLWISPVDDTTTIYVDFDNDGAPDRTLLLNRLDVERVTDTYDQNNEGTRLWSDKAFAVSYGESAMAHPQDNLDFGYTVLPFLTDWKSNFLIVDKTASPSYHTALGMSSKFTITADAPKVDIFTVNVTDTLPVGWNYVSGSTYINFTFGGTNRSGLAAEPMVTGSVLTWTNVGTIRKGARLTVTFTARSTVSSTYGSNVNTVLVEGYDIAGNVFDAQAEATVYIQPPPIKTKELYLQRTLIAVKAIDGTMTNNIMNRTSPKGSSYKYDLTSPLYLYLYPELASNLSVFGYVNLTLYLQNSGSGMVEFNLYDVDSLGAKFPVARSFTTVSGSSIKAYKMGVSNVYYTVPTRHALLMEVKTASGTYSTVYFGSPTYPSVLTVNTYTYVKIEVADTYKGSSKTQYFYRGETVKVYSRATDPFGSYDITNEKITIFNPLGGVMIIDVPMTLVATDPSTPSAWKDYTYNHLIKTTDPMGWYKVMVTATEGNGVTHTLTTNFYVSYYGVVVDPDSTKYGKAGTSVDHSLYIVNVGQLQDRFSLFFSSSTLGWGSTLIISGTTVARDDDGDGTYEYVNPAWDSNGDSIPDVNLYAGENLSFVVRRSIPVSADKGDADVVRIFGRSFADPNVIDNATLTTGVPAPPERIKELYLHTLSSSPDGKLDRIAPTGSSPATKTINEQSTYYWKLVPTLADKFTVKAAKARLYLDVSGASPHAVTVQIYDSSIKVAETTKTISASAGWYEFQVPISYTFSANAQIRLGVYLPSSSSPATLTITYDASSYPSKVEFNTTTYVNVKWVKTYDSTGAERGDFKQGETVYVRAYVTDPFGDYDISSASIRITNPQGQVVVNGASMSTYSSSPRIYEYQYQIPIGVFGGTYKINVTAVEGNGVVDYGEATFDLAMGDMGIDKTGDKVYVVPWDRITYTIYYNNTGTSIAPMVWVNDTLPAGVKFIGSSISPSYISGNDVRWEMFNVAPGPHSFAVEVEVQNVPDGTVLTNSVIMVFRDAGGKVHDPQSDVFTSTVRLTTIVASKTVDKALAYPNETIVYTIYYNNSGSWSAPYLWVNDTIPTGTQFVSSSIPYDSSSGNTYRWVLKDVAPGAHSFTVSVKLGPLAPMTVLTNVANMAHTDVSGKIHASSDTATTIVRGPLMTFEKRTDKTSAYPNDLVTFTIWYNNTGNDPANLWINDTLPAGMSYVSSSLPYYSKSGSTYTWKLTGVAVGAHSFTITVRILGSALGTLVNAASMDVKDVKGNAYARMFASASVKVLVPVFEMSKVAVAKATPFDLITYTIWYNNTGNANASMLWVNDTLPTMSVYVSSSVPYASKSGNVYTWTFANVSVGAHSFTVTIKLGKYPDGTTVTNNVSGTYIVGSVKFVKYAEHKLIVYAPIIVASKVGDRLVATIGDVVTYTLWYNNTGHDAASIVWVNDTIPSNTQFVSSSIPYDFVSGMTYTWIVRNVTPGAHYMKVSIKVLASAQFNTWLVNLVNETYTDSTGDLINSSESSYAFRVQAPIILPAKQGAISQSDRSIITYTVWYNNTGVQSAGDVWLNDTLPSYLQFVSGSPVPSNVSGNVVSWHFKDVAVGPHSVSLTVKVLPGIFAGTKIVNRADVNYTDLKGNMMLPSWAIHVLPYPYGVQRFVFEKGTIVIPMDSMQDTGSGQDYYPSQIHAYGLVYWALKAGVPVFWAVNSTNGYRGLDFTALTDDDGNPNVTGNATSRGYKGGPFLIRDPTNGTSYNEAWDLLKVTALKYGYMDVKLHELQEQLTLDPWDVYQLSREPRIALRNDSKKAGWTSPSDQFPYLWNWSYSPSARIPMTNLTDADIRGGALMTVQAGSCSSPNYDMLLIGDEEFQDSSLFPASDTLFGSIEDFASSSGHVSLGCIGATLATRIGWFVNDSVVLEENDLVRDTILRPWYVVGEHPMLQTWGTVRANRGTFMAWDASNNWSDGTKPLILAPEQAPGDGTGEVWKFPDGYEAVPDVINGSAENDVAYLYTLDGLGVISYLGGHTQGTDMPNGAMTSTVQPRIALDSMLYSVLTPRPSFDVSPRFAQAGTWVNVTVLLGFDAGEFIWGGNLTLAFEKNVTLKNIQLMVPWGTWGMSGASGANIAVSYYDPRFDPFLARLDLSVYVSTALSVQSLLSVKGTLRDQWNEYSLNASGCVYIMPKFAPDSGPVEDAGARLSIGSAGHSIAEDKDTSQALPAQRLALISERRPWNG